LQKSWGTASSTTAWNCTASPSTAITKPAAPGLNARALLRIVGCVLLFAVIAPLHLGSKLLLRRSAWPPRFLAAVAWLLGVRVHLTGFPSGPRTMLIANHTSWIDILLLGGSLGSAFVSKDTLGHGFLHWLAAQNGTMYVRRSHRKGAKDQAVTIARALEGDQPVAVFPEGTTGPGTHLLPFRSTLLEAAHLASGRIHVRPVAIDYGAARSEVAWFDEESGKDNVVRILGRPGMFRVTVHVLGPLDPHLDRKRLTADAASAIALTLGFKSPSHSSMAVVE
jgi:1-acyl-sn-glycerol-3-phosphate acyltransferase